MKRISIIGGGISGLTVAYLLSEKSDNLDITVFESEDRPGGKIWTERADGFLCERGPNGFLDNKPHTLSLCKSLGIEPVRSNENSKKRFIFSSGILKQLPESPLSFIKSDLLSWPGKLRLLYELFAPMGPEEETVAEFITRRLGREALEKLIDPMASGIYAGDPSTMSMKSCFPRIKELEQEYGSLIKAMFQIKKKKRLEKNTGEESKVSAAPGGTLTSFYNGAQTITDAMADKLGDRIRLGTPVQSITKEKGCFHLHTSANIHESDLVIIASPAYAAAGILRDFDRDLSDTLRNISYPHLSVVCFGYEKNQVTHPLNGFGFLVPHREQKKILGTLWDSSIFPNRASEGNVLLRTMAGGAQSPEIESLTDDKLIDAVFSELKPMLGLKRDPDFVRLFRWSRAIPQYLTGHTQILNTIDETLSRYPGLFLAGNSYRGIGINDCVENGYKLADRILKNLPINFGG